MAVAFSLPAWALGLGELSLVSALSLPFSARIALLDVPARFNADCFSVQSPQLPGLQVALVRDGAGARLQLRSPAAVNELFVELDVRAGCEGNTARSYQVLLDPPRAEPPDAARQEAVRTDAARADAAVRLAPERLPQARADSAPRPRRARVETRTKSAPLARAPAASTTATARAEDRLVLSGSTAQADALTTPREEAGARTPSALARAATLSDELTAMERNTAYLEARLASLRQQLATLPPPAEVTPATPEPPLWGLLGIALLLLGAGVGLAALIGRRPRVPVAFDPDTFPLPFTRNADPTPSIQPSPWPRKPAPTPAASTSDAPAPAVPATNYRYGQSVADAELGENILDQAEVCLAHGNQSLAAQLLREHLAVAPTESPAPWLLLLDILEQQGKTAEYAIASAEARQWFNVDTRRGVGRRPAGEDQPAVAEASALSGIERYPHLVTGLSAAWHDAAARSAFLDALLTDTRGGTRSGLAYEAFRDAAFLRELSRSLDPA